MGNDRYMDEQLLPDLLRLRGSVVAASDEFFAAKENLIKPDGAGLRAGHLRSQGAGLRRGGRPGGGAGRTGRYRNARSGTG